MSAPADTKPKVEKKPKAPKAPKAKDANASSYPLEVNTHFHRENALKCALFLWVKKDH